MPQRKSSVKARASLAEFGFEEDKDEVFVVEGEFVGRESALARTRSVYNDKGQYDDNISAADGGDDGGRATPRKVCEPKPTLLR
jgi:hypothetical protein